VGKNKSWIVYKFGGTSMGSAERISRVADIVLNRRDRHDTRIAVVVSAMSGVTDALIHLTQLATARSKDLPEKISQLREKHLETAHTLLPSELVEEFQSKFERDLESLSKVLDAISVVRESSDRLKDFVSGLGEVWSASILNLLMRHRNQKSAYIDARLVLTITPSEQGPIIQWNESKERMDRIGYDDQDMLVITGFVCRTPQDVPATLGRNGSDYSASIFGYLLDAKAVEIWTDVDGVMSADPRRVGDAIVIPELSYREAIELANFGAKVLHPGTMVPAVMKGIPILIKNTFHPEAPGSRIENTTPKTSEFVVKGCATVDEVSILYIETSGTAQTEIINSRLLSSLADHRVVVLMGSFGSPGNSLSYAIQKGQGDLAKMVAEKTFASEISSGVVQLIELHFDQSILAIVSDTMAKKPGVASRYFDSLSKAGISARIINQGFSERNISVVVPKADITKALRSAHAGFYLSPQTISLGLIGPGGVGSVFLEELAKIEGRLEKDASLDIRLRGIINSQAMLLSDKEIAVSRWRETIAGQGKKANLQEFISHIKSGNLPHVAIIDCSGSPEIAGQYAQWLREGIHVISPSKLANSASLPSYKELQQLTRTNLRHYLYESSVCGSLPVIETLADLIQTGDEIYRIEAVLSGSLSYIFASMTSGKSFSACIQEVLEKGLNDGLLTEDLTGMDAMRKTLILAREMGLELEIKDVQVEEVMHLSLDSGSEQILAQAALLDEKLTQKMNAARASGEVLHYVASIDKKTGASLAIRNLPTRHAFSQLEPGENAVAFYTRRLGKEALIVRGPGAGREIVAAGAIADLLRLTRYLGSIG